MINEGDRLTMSVITVRMIAVGQGTESKAINNAEALKLLLLSQF